MDEPTIFPSVPALGEHATANLTGFAENLRQSLLVRAPLPLWVLSHRPVPNSVAVLFYHRTTPALTALPAADAPTHNITPDRFGAQIEGLLERGYCPWPLREVLTQIDAGEPLPEKVFAVTFDDGHISNYLHAWPILKDLHVPATIFLATDYIDSEAAFPFDDWRWAGYETMPWETWRPLTGRQCHEMLASGLIEFGAHTHTHQDFRGRPRVFEGEVRTSLDVLHDRFGIKEAAFAFPWGKRRTGFASPELAEAARRAGALCAFTTESELVQPERDRFDWGRFTASQTDTAATLAAKIDGWYTRARDLGRRLANHLADHAA